jgi:hypothetical protein
LLGCFFLGVCKKQNILGVFGVILFFLLPRFGGGESEFVSIFQSIIVFFHYTVNRFGREKTNKQTNNQGQKENMNRKFSTNTVICQNIVFIHQSSICNTQRTKELRHSVYIYIITEQAAEDYYTY